MSLLLRLITISFLISFCISCIERRRENAAVVANIPNTNKIEKKVIEKTATLKKLGPSSQEYPEEYKKYDRRYHSLWKEVSHKIFYGEEMELEIKYFRVVAGRIVIKTMPNTFVSNREVYHIQGNIRSAPFYRYIYKLRDSIETFLDVKTFLPLKYSLIQRESGQKVNDLQVFNHQDLQTHFTYKRVKKGKTKEIDKAVPIPHYFQDSFSALQFARGLPFMIGKKYEFPVVTRGKVWIVQMEALKREKLKIANRKYSAIKVKAKTKFPGVLRKKGDIFFWFSDDPTRKILGFDARVKFGKIKARLVRYRAGQKEKP